MAADCLMYVDAVLLAASVTILQNFPGKKKTDVGGQGATLEEVKAERPAEDGPALEGPALEGPALEGPALKGPALEGTALERPADGVVLVLVDPATPAIGWVQEKLRTGALFCVEFCDAAEADGSLEEFNPDEDG